VTPDPELLGRYCDQRDEAAFAELVRRHVKLVYGTALRLAQGETPLAEDVTQTVFTDLARKAAKLRGHATVAGWLHTGARFAAAKSIRAERLRRTREQEASAMNELTTTLDDPTWTQMRPLIDEAVGRLGEYERNAVLLRFFQDKSYREIGDLLGVSEDAARMRVERALERLRGQFARRGLTASAAFIASALGASAASVPAAGFSATLAQKSLAGAAVATGTGKFSSIKFLALLAGGSALAATATVSFSPWGSLHSTREAQPIAAIQSPMVAQTPSAAATPANPIALLAPAALAPAILNPVATAVLQESASPDVSASENAVNTVSQAANNQPASSDSSTPASQDPSPSNTNNANTSQLAQPPIEPAGTTTGIAIFGFGQEKFPYFVDTSGILKGKTITAIANGHDHVLALCSDGTLVSFQLTAARQNPYVPPDIIPVRVDTSSLPAGTNITTIAAGGDSDIAICSDGSVYVWGQGQATVVNSQAGVAASKESPLSGHATTVKDQASTKVAKPTLLNTGALKGRKAVAISVGAGGLYGLALCADGTLVAWGDNSLKSWKAMGDFGHSPGPPFHEPERINEMGALQGKTIKAISTTDTGDCDGLVLCSDGTAVQWGWPHDAPVPVNADGILNGKTITAIASGRDLSGVVLCSDGTLAEWWQNSAPQDIRELPDPRPHSASYSNSAWADATRVLDGKSVTAVSAEGPNGYLILCSDGTLTSLSNGPLPILLDRTAAFKGKTILAIAPDMVLFQEPATSGDQSQ
jgi:RNA polymerase sigma factor (sigma-70 family)